MSYFEQTKVTDSTGLIINPVQDETVLLLRRLVKLLESNAVVDSSNRQKVTVEGATITSGTVTTVSTVTAVTTVSTVSNVALVANVDPRFQMIDWARQAYNSGIRANLTFS